MKYIIVHNAVMCEMSKEIATCLIYMYVLNDVAHNDVNAVLLNILNTTKLFLFTYYRR